MNGIKTTMLLAALTALFMGLGYTLGGTGGAIIALVVAAGMNLFTFWNYHWFGEASAKFFDVCTAASQIRYKGAYQAHG